MSMNIVTMLDGDFNFQLTRNLKQIELNYACFELQALTTNRSAVYETHMDFLRAGSRIIRTNTYRASAEHFAEYLHISPSEGEHLITVAVHIALKAVQNHYVENGGNILDLATFNSCRSYVAGACGSFAVGYFNGINNCPPYWNNITKQDLVSWHRKRIKVLLKANVDMLAFESIPCAIEAEALFELLQEFPNICAWITFFCPNGEQLMDGRNFQDVALQCYHSLPRQIIAIGVCCSRPALVTLALARINDYAYPHGNIPLIACSDKNFLYYDDGKFECDSITRYVQEWLNIGVRYIGGANQVNADDINDIWVEVQKYCSASNQNAIMNVVRNACSLRYKKDKSKI